MKKKQIKKDDIEDIEAVASKKSFFEGRIFSVLVLIVFSVVTAGSSYYMYTYTQTLLHDRLRERLIAITSTAALYFTDEEMSQLREMALEKKDDTIYEDLYKDIVYKLQAIRETNENIQYVYIMGKTDDPETLLFLADADVTEELILEEGDEGNDYPGSDYDASEAPVLQNDAFLFPIADYELIEDEWGLLLASYAPIKNEYGIADTIIGIDVDVSEYVKVVNATFLPFLLFIILLLLLLTTLTYTLVRVWGARVQLLRELDRQKDELLSIVSHQLATPISAVRWNLEIMVDGDLGKFTDEQEKHLKSMQPQADNLSDLASMILDVSRLQLGKMKVDRTETDVAKFASEVFDEVEPSSKERGIKYVKSIAKDVPKAMLDQRLTRMTMENLLTNAVKYTPKGGTVELKVEVQGKNIHYEVSDTGCGIPKKDHDKIFGKMFRASNVGDVDGNGFGLYVAKGAVESQGGKISFKSIEKKGTTFIVDLPIVSPMKK